MPLAAWFGDLADPAERVGSDGRPQSVGIINVGRAVIVGAHLFAVGKPPCPRFPLVRRQDDLAGCRGI